MVANQGIIYVSTGREVWTGNNSDPDKFEWNRGEPFKQAYRDLTSVVANPVAAAPDTRVLIIGDK